MSTPPQLRVVSLESRNAGELARLLERHGCVAIRAPSLREVPLADQAGALAFGEALCSGRCDVLVLLTGVGLRTLLDALAARWPREQVVAALRGVQLACRGPKPVAVLKSLGLRPAAVGGEPNTWQELLVAMDRDVPVAGKRVFVQEYGRASTELAKALQARGGSVVPFAVYAWALPEDLQPLRAAVRLLCARGADVLAFTSAKQAEHLCQVAAELGLAAALATALRSWVAVASIGPVTTQALGEHGLAVDVEPAHPKMGHLAAAIAHEARRVLAGKRARLAAPSGS